MMQQNAHDAYLESRILSADPLELVKLMYQGAIHAVRDARRHLAKGDIVARSKAITKAASILLELTVSLDYERGGQLSCELGRLYDYMNRRLLEANLKQMDQPLEEVLGLLLTMLEGWEGIQPQEEPEPEPEVKAARQWSQPMTQAMPDAGSSYGAHAWNF